MAAWSNIIRELFLGASSAALLAYTQYSRNTPIQLNAIPPTLPPTHTTLEWVPLVPLVPNTRNVSVGLEINTVTNYNFAVCGHRGSGKSTFVNAIRGIEDGSDLAAPVSETCVRQRKLKPQPYADQSQSKIVYWDVPTGRLQEESFRHHLCEFDIVLLFTSNRFTKLDFTIAKLAACHNVPVVFVRNKVDVDVGARMTRSPLEMLSAKRLVIDEIKSVLSKQLEKAGLSQFPLLFTCGFGFRDKSLAHQDEDKLILLLNETIQRSQML